MIKAHIEYTDPISTQARVPCLTLSSFFAPTFCPPNVAIVAPSASKGAEKNILTLLAAVIEAIETAPREFTLICNITDPSAVME